MHMDEDLAATMTRSTGNRLDFHNIGGLLQQRVKQGLWGLWSHYSWRELAIRGGILATTAFCAYFAARESENKLTNGLLGAGFGFFTPMH